MKWKGRRKSENLIDQRGKSGSGISVPPKPKEFSDEEVKEILKPQRIQVTPGKWTTQ